VRACRGSAGCRYPIRRSASAMTRLSCSSAVCWSSARKVFVSGWRLPTGPSAQIPARRTPRFSSSRMSRFNRSVADSAIEPSSPSATTARQRDLGSGSFKVATSDSRWRSFSLPCFARAEAAAIRTNGYSSRSSCRSWQRGTLNDNAQCSSHKHESADKKNPPTLRLSGSVTSAKRLVRH